MALDTTRVRRRLPQPPTDGSPGIDKVPQRLDVDNEVPTDGRSLRATGRVVQMNIKTSPQIKARFLALAKRRGLLMVDLFEEAIAALENQEAGR